MRYIENRREQHRKMTFQDELQALLTRHGVANKQGVSQPRAREFASHISARRSQSSPTAL